MTDKFKHSNTNFILQSVENEIDFTVYKKIYVGFSGGADSTALLIILNKLSDKYEFELNAVHFEHGLRGQKSISDAAWCRKFCKDLNIPIQEFSLDVKSRIKTGEGVEACARRLRIEVFKTLINSDEDAIALGHHLDDKIENFFIRLIRGSNSSGLTSLRAVSTLKRMTILRPMLKVSKTKIETFLRFNSIDNWKIDHTNAENLYRRNLIRNRILPNLYKLIPESKAGIIRAEEAIETDADFIEQVSRKKYNELFTNGRFPKTLKINNILNLHTAIRSRIYRYWLSDLLGFEFIPSRNLILRINSELNKNSSESILIPLYKEKFLLINSNSLTLFSPNKGIENDFQFKIWDWKRTPIINVNEYTIKVEIITDLEKDKTNAVSYAYFDCSSLPNKLMIKTWKEGDRFIPYGSDSPVKVKRIFKNNKIPIGERKHVPLICLQNKTIIWIAGLKRSSFAPISNNTLKIAFFSVSKKKLFEK